MQNNLIKRRYDTFSRIDGFHTKYGTAFAAGSRGATLFTAIGTVAEKMEGSGAKQLSGTGEYRGGTSGKRFWYGEVKEDLTEMRDTAVSIAEAEDTPDFDDSFRLPRSQSYDAMATAARAFLKDAAPHKATFIEFEMPADFLEDLADDLAKFEAADDAQDAGQSSQVGGTADLVDLANQGMKLRKQLQAIVRNKFKGNAAVLAEWESAQHIEATAKGKKVVPAQS